YGVHCHDHPPLPCVYPEQSKAQAKRVSHTMTPQANAMVARLSTRRRFISKTPNSRPHWSCSVDFRDNDRRSRSFWGSTQQNREATAGAVVQDRCERRNLRMKLAAGYHAPVSTISTLRLPH